MSITVAQSAAPILRPGDPGWGLDVVTATELRQFPITEVHAGLLWWPIHAAPGVLPAWRGLTQNGVPDGFTPSGIGRPPRQQAGTRASSQHR